MALKFDEHDAVDMSRMIRRRRPNWAYKAIMSNLQRAALAGASIGQVMAAAEKAMNNPKHLTPDAINFPENWVQAGSKTAGNIAADRLCAECTTKFPADQVSRHPSGSGYICNNH